jgi:hypothetical protein
MNDKRITSDTPRDVRANLWRWNRPVSTMPSGHQIFRKGIRVIAYHAYNPEMKQVDMQVNGSERNGIFKIANLLGRKGSTITAHEFYHHLMSHPNHRLTLYSSDIQTKGGRETWRKLSQYSDIEMQHVGPGILGGLFRSKLHLHTGEKWGFNYAPEFSNSRFTAKKKE